MTRAGGERSIEELIEASSLGTPGAKAIRERTPPEVVGRIMAEVERRSTGRADYEQACIQDALDVIEQYGQIDGAHHKAWVIDQVVRALTDEGYDAWVTAYTQDGEYAWDEGIAP